VIALRLPGAAGDGRNLLVLSWMSFLQDTAGELLYPILAIYLTVVMGAPPAWSARAGVVGVVEGVAEARHHPERFGCGRSRLRRWISFARRW
jgi:hypothetical protein